VHWKPRQSRTPCVDGAPPEQPLRGVSFPSLVVLVLNPAVQEVLVLERGEYRGSKVTKVMLTPHTGRRHQLRVHLNSIGHPIVGDYTYCGDADSPRMMLHAHKLTLPLPPRFGNTRSWEASDPFDDILVRSQ
jgi:23S rRNA-/tRNA-specific pseudouridylate synthase